MKEIIIKGNIHKHLFHFSSTSLVIQQVLGSDINFQSLFKRASYRKLKYFVPFSCPLYTALSWVSKHETKRNYKQCMVNAVNSEAANNLECVFIHKALLVPRLSLKISSLTSNKISRNKKKFLSGKLTP